VRVNVHLELDPPIERFDPKDPLSYIISENLIRRQLSAGQWADFFLDSDSFG
jgi:hypothetical protein